MKRIILKVFASIIMFALTLSLAGYIMNRGNVNTTKEMDMASFPSIYMVVNGESINQLCGYATDMEVGLLRENITPLDENRGVSFRVVKYGQRVNSVCAKIRSVDGSRLIEIIDVTDYDEDTYSIYATVNFKDLIEQNKEYSLEICLNIAEGKEIMYHTRVIDAPLYCAKEKLAFVLDFHKKSLSDEYSEELRTYMEPNRTGDNTTLAYVNIHSSMAQLAFADLPVREETTPVASFKELAPETAVINVDYIATATVDGVTRRYFINEYYRIKYTKSTTYLLDFERTMHQVPDEDRITPALDTILLGITDSDVGLCENDAGTIIAFCNENKLYSYDIGDNRMTKLFSFYDDQNFDPRTYNNMHNIKVLRVDETGSVWFAVSGYMNRGTYEGHVGIAFYEYNGPNNVIDELFFIESNQSPEIVMLDADELSYLSSNGVYYFMMNRAIYAIDLDNSEVECIVSGLEDDMYDISDSRSMVVWQTGEDINSSASLKVMNLNTRQISQIDAPDGEYIKPLAFMGEDFIYGLSVKTDVVTDTAGRVTFPMYCLKIQNEFGELLKVYKEDDVYITDIEKRGNLLAMTRMYKTTDDRKPYALTDEDYITNNQDREYQNNTVEVVENGIFEKVIQIRLMKESSGKTVWLTPKEVIYEGSRIVQFDRAEKTKNYYYVYYNGGLRQIVTNESKAVICANDKYGNVLNDNGIYTWYRANRDLRNQIMILSIDGDKTVENTLAFCMDKMMEYEGVFRNSEYLMKRGQTVLSVLENNLDGKDVLDLTGAPLDSVLYYVNRDIPVLAMTSDNNYLIIGFNQIAIVVLDPVKGTYKMGINEAEKLFEESGNQFITYVPNS